MHVIHYDPDANVLRLRMTGFWTMDDMHRFTADLLTTIAHLPPSCRTFDVLSDGRNFPVQSPEVAEALRRITAAEEGTNKTGRKAIVVTSMINKMQAERSLAGTNTRVFRSIDDAQAWLATPRRDSA